MTLLNLSPLHPAKRIIEREPRRRPQPADWGFGMTICIGALCEREECVVAVSDELITLDDVAGEGLALKNFHLLPNWSALFAADDVGHIPFILSRAQEILKGPAGYAGRAEDLANAVSLAYEEQLDREINAQLLTPLGLTRKELLGNRATHIPPTTLDSLIRQTGRIRLGCEFLLVGLDEREDGHLILVTGDSAPRSLNSVGFWAIGSGAPSAISSLSFHADHGRFNRFMRLSECIYHLCEAKFIAEANRGVGKKTFVSIFQRGHTPRIIQTPGTERIRRAWERYGAPRRPKKIITEIPALLIEEDTDFTGANCCASW